MAPGSQKPSAGGSSANDGGERVYAATIARAKALVPQLRERARPGQKSFGACRRRRSRICTRPVSSRSFSPNGMAAQSSTTSLCD